MVGVWRELVPMHLVRAPAPLGPVGGQLWRACALSSRRSGLESLLEPVLPNNSALIKFEKVNCTEGAALKRAIGSKDTDNCPPAFPMESYRVTGMPNTGPQRVYTQPSRSSRTNTNVAGSYGLSIRVQGIDGHPLSQSQSSSMDRIHSPQPPMSSDTPAARPQPSLSLNVAQPQVAQPQSKARSSNIITSQSMSPQPTALNNASDGNHREPDVLPLRRIDSSGPVLQPSRSRHSSSSSTNTSKTHFDEQDPLFTDAINRHKNRRYIPFLPGSGRDIDTGSIPGVDELIEKFDSSQQRRGRAGRRNRINPEDRKRSRSVDSAYGLREGSGYTRGTSMEHVLRPSQLRKSVSGHQDSWITSVDGKPDSRPSSRANSEPGSPQSTVSKTLSSMKGYRNPQTRTSYTKSEGGASPAPNISTTALSTSLSKQSATLNKKTTAEADVHVTPDLLKGQQALSQQTHEETAKQILFNYLKDGSSDSDETTKRKVNLVFEKIQTLKSRATASAQGDNNTVDISAHTRALQGQNAELEKELSKLKNQLEEQTTKKTERRLTSTLKELQHEQQKSEEECQRLKGKVTKAETDLQTTVEELFQVKMEREQYQTEIRDLQDQLSEMHDELDTAKKSAADGERDALLTDLMQLKAELQQTLLAKEDQEELLHRRERELTALKGALKEEVSAHDQEVDKMREQYELEISRLQATLEDTKQTSAATVREKAEVEAAKGAVEGQAGRLSQEAEKLRRRIQELENEVAKLNRIIDEAKLQESRLTDRVTRLQKEKKQLEESLSEIREQEEEMSRANRALTVRLEDVQRNFTKLANEHKDLEERLQEEKAQKEQFKNMKNDIEDERRLLDRTVEKLQKEMNDIVDASQSSTRELQEQIDIYKEKNRRELTELQRLLKERTQEADKYFVSAKTLQDELLHKEADLQKCLKVRDEAILEKEALERKLHDLEIEAETRNNTKEDTSRHVKLLEDRVAQLEMDLDEERQSGDQLMNRIDRGREQVEQMRNELLQERASRQDLECDKVALERQNKDLKSRVTHLESSQKSNKEGQISQLEGRVQELEERLEAEERERGNLQLVNRRLERKVKEMVMQVEEEQNALLDEKNQLNLRVKALKRQMDEAEEEIDRLENGKKKLQRELDDQQETNDQLQSQLKAMRSEMRRKSSSAPLLNTLDDEDDDDDDDVSTDGETYFRSTLSYKRSSSQDNILSSFAILQPVDLDTAHGRRVCGERKGWEGPLPEEEKQRVDTTRDMLRYGSGRTVSSTTTTTEDSPESERKFRRLRLTLHAGENGKTRDTSEQNKDAKETWKKKNGLIHRERPAGRESPQQQLSDGANGGTESSVQSHGPKIYGIVQTTGSDRQQEVMAREWSVSHLQNEMRYIREVRDSLEKVRERMYSQFGGMQQSMQKLTQEIKTSNSRSRSLEAEVRVRTEAMDSFDQMNSSLISANIGLQKSLLENCQNRVDLRENVKTLRSNYEKTQEKLRDKEKELAYAQAENQTLRLQMESSQEAGTRALHELSAKLKQEYDKKLREEQLKHREEIENLQAQLDEYIRRLEEAEKTIKNSEAKIAERDQRILEVERLLSCMGNEKSQLQKQLQISEQRLRLLELSDTTDSNVVKKSKQLEGEVADLKERIKHLNDMVFCQQRKVKGMIEEVQILRAQVAQKDMFISELLDRIAIVECENNELEDNLKYFMSTQNGPREDLETRDVGVGCNLLPSRILEANPSVPSGISTYPLSTTGDPPVSPRRTASDEVDSGSGSVSPSRRGVYTPFMKLMEMTAKINIE
uniref:Myosin tail domain-containing protein n=1 Tax=Knipowitschia caucasica TaxID=637954 RepID=A0AAV2LSA7_KNICA